NRDEDSVMEKALEAGAEDFVREDDQFVVSTAPADLHAVKQALEASGLVASEAALTWVPKSSVRVEGENATTLIKLLEQLEDLDDVQKVDANFDMDMPEMSE
ncbi:MAG: YebC/PmpR family DNA-binding transcriptional regulator, partial [Gemmatimonas sp.]|nr:YebC/PmpR family DNA-binding transcriptional regulator [Gemmatimonas sp.]